MALQRFAAALALIMSASATPQALAEKDGSRAGWIGAQRFNPPENRDGGGLAMEAPVMGVEAAMAVVVTEASVMEAALATVAAATEAARVDRRRPRWRRGS